MAKSSGKRSLYFLAFYCTMLPLFPKSLLAINSITPSQPIYDNQTIASPSQQFELGFFLPSNSSTAKYLGIWFKNIPDKNVVWVANRDNPLENSTGTLTFGNEGNLVLLNQTGSILWSSYVPKPAKNPIALLLDDGNFVLKDESSEEYLWQSFEHPTDTLLPGMKLGWNLETGFNTSLTSWRGYVDPSSGKYTYGVDLQGVPQLVLREGNRKFFRTGPWDGEKFSGDPVLSENSVFIPTFISNSSHVYYSYENINEEITSKFVVDHSGLVQHFLWNAKQSSWNPLFPVQGDQCDIYGTCGSFGSCDIINDNTPRCQCLEGFEPKTPEDWEVFDWSGGCVRKDEQICGKGEWFEKYDGVKLPDASLSSSVNLEDCEDNCLRNCSCLAYAKLDINGNGNTCITWYGELIDTRKVSEFGQELYVRVAASERVKNSDVDTNRKQKPLVLAVSLTVTSAFLIVLLVIGFIICKGRRKGAREEDNEVGAGRVDSQENDLELPLFEMAVIEAATDNFSSTNRIGEGGFGPVYKGELPSGLKVAVKRLAQNSGQGMEEFKNEVILISQLQHRNLVKLLGCCIQGEERMLIYEYMPNRSLDFLIFETHSCALNWRKRYDIVIGIARGLLYLHRDSRLRIIHRDLKASNVLLDSDMNPRISDFGMARMFHGDQTEAKTKRVVGTYGYMPPEYAIDGHFSVKSDVYSFGVLLLEILSGKRNRGFFHPDHKLNLLGHAWKLWYEGKASELMDPRLENEYHIPAALRCIQVGLLCSQQHPEERPNMSSVVLMLDSEDMMLPQPGRPGFYTERSFSETDDSSSAGRKNSNSNDVTSSLLEGR